MKRSTPLTANTDHSWSRDGRNYWTCGNSGCTAREFSPDGEPDVGYACEGGLARSELERGSGPAPYSTSNSGRPNRDEKLLEYARQQPCVACGDPPPSDPHHVKSRGAGHGDRLEDGTCNVVSLCRGCHDALDSVGGGKQTFQRKQDISLAEEAERIGEAYREER